MENDQSSWVHRVKPRSLMADASHDPDPTVDGMFIGARHRFTAFLPHSTVLADRRQRAASFASNFATARREAQRLLPFITRRRKLQTSQLTWDDTISSSSSHPSTTSSNNNILIHSSQLNTHLTFTAFHSHPLATHILCSCIRSLTSHLKNLRNGTTNSGGADQCVPLAIDR
jgi:hypothetical protein